MISAVACGLDPSSYLLPFGWNYTLCRVAGPLLPGFPPSLVSARLPSGSVMAVAVIAVFYATVGEA